VLKPKANITSVPASHNIKTIHHEEPLTLPESSLLFKQSLSYTGRVRTTYYRLMFSEICANSQASNNNNLRGADQLK